MSFEEMNFKDKLKKMMGKKGLKPGTYEAYIEKATPKFFQNSGNDGIILTLTVRPDIEQDGSEDEIMDFMIFSEAAIYKVEMLFEATELTFEDWETQEELAKLLEGMPVCIEVVETEYRGAKKPHVQSYSKGKPISED